MTGEQLREIALKHRTTVAGYTFADLFDFDAIAAELAAQPPTAGPTWNGAIEACVHICEFAARGTIEKMGEECRSETWKILAEQSVEQYKSLIAKFQRLKAPAPVPQEVNGWQVNLQNSSPAPTGECDKLREALSEAMSKVLEYDLGVCDLPEFKRWQALLEDGGK